MRALAGHQSVRLTGDKELRRLTAAQPQPALVSIAMIAGFINSSLLCLSTARVYLPD
jgi:hypothetical protein